MTTNQTIDGVPRASLELLLSDIPNHPSAAWKELRALLDVSLTDEGEKPAAQPQGEPVALAQGVGVLTFMRSTSEDATRCACCEGNHVFCRYFDGLPDFNDLTQDLRHRNDLEGQEFRVTVELVAKQPAPVSVVPAPTYRLLGDGDIIQEGDETLNDDTATWGKVPMGVFRGMPYNRRVMLPVRRATS